MSALQIAEASPSRTTVAGPDLAELRAQAAASGAQVWRIFRPALRLMAKALMEHRIRQATRELAQLDDRLLKDIGLSRWALEDAVRTNRAVNLFPNGRS